MSGPSVSSADLAAVRRLGDVRLSPDGDRVAFVERDAHGSRLRIVDLARGEVEHHHPAPAGREGAYAWAPVGEGLVVADREGLHVSGRSGRRLVAGGPGHSAPAVSPDGGRVAWVHDLERILVAPLAGDGPTVEVTSDADFVMDPAWGPDSAELAWVEWDVPDMAWDRSRVVSWCVDEGGARPVDLDSGLEGRVSRSQPRWGGGRAFGFVADAGGTAQVVTGRDGARRRVEVVGEHCRPAWGPGQRSWAWDVDGTVVVASIDGARGSLHRWGDGGDVVLDDGRVWTSVTAAGGRVAGVASGPRCPDRVVVLEPGRPERVLATAAPEPFFGLDHPDPEEVEVDSTDGTVVPARLHRPARERVGSPPPLLCMVHGGPTDQWPLEHRPEIDVWVEHGWAVLVPDHRGSTGHGRAFTQALRGRWGELDVADVAGALATAAARGWCDPTRMALVGRSAGGFTALGVLAAHPRLCAAGAVSFPVCDLLDDETHRFEAHYTDSLVGPRPAADELRRSRSPITFADRITAPVLVLHGADDEVVAAHQSASLADAMAAAGGVVERHVYDGEGHGWQRPETVRDAFDRTADFLRRHVLGKDSGR